MTNAPVRVAAVSLVATFALLILKLVLAFISDSIAVLSDALDSGTDLIAGAAALISVRVAAWPADEDHPYGHGKIESISAGASAAVIALGGAFVLIESIRRLVTGVPEIHLGPALLAMIVAAVVNLVMAWLMRREARRSHSLALAAESTHLQTNVVQTGTVMGGLALVAVTGSNVFDPIVALGLAAYMGVTAIGLVRSALSEIMDVALPEHELRVIHDVLVQHAGEIRGFHELRSRRSGPTRHVDMHLIVDPNRTLQEVHDTCDRIELEIEKRLPGAKLTIHPEPDDGRRLGPLERLVREAASRRGS